MFMSNPEEMKKKIEELEAAMNSAEFWADKDKAQALIREYEALKNKLTGVGKYDAGGAVMTIFSGAGGDDAEDFSRMLLEMYQKFFNKRKWNYRIIHKNENDHGGYRNITLEINLPAFTKASAECGPYGTLKNESGGDCPGGQNVNNRETAVRLVHLPTNLAVHVESERSQAQNRERAQRMLEAKLYKLLEAERMAKEKGMYISKTTQIEWGNQIRSYVLHPYKMVKDHRTDVEVRNVEEVLDGEIGVFLEAERDL